MAQAKKRKSAVKWLVFLLIIVLLLCWFEGWIPGIGSGRELLSRRQNKGADTAVTTVAVTDAVVAEHAIVLTKDQITLDGEVISFEDLAKKIQTWPAETKVQLSEDGAIKDTYDQVVRLLDEQRIEH